MLHQSAIATACLSMFIFAANPLFAAPGATPSAPATQPTLARRLADATARVKAAHAAMEAAKLAAIRRYDAGKGGTFVAALAASEAAAANASALGPQARINVLSTLAHARSDVEWGHAKAIEEDPGVASATQAVASTQSVRHFGGKWMRAKWRLGIRSWFDLSIASKTLSAD